MRNLLALAFILLPLSLHAGVITFECKSVEIPGVHKFDAKGIVTINEENGVEGVVSIQTQKAQAEGSVQVFEEMNIFGTRQHFPAGEITKLPFDQLTLFTKQTYIKSLNILLDFKGEVSSQVLSIDNFVYRSNCYSVETSNK